MTAPVVRRKADCPVQEHPWGQLTWFASGALGNCQDMTVGRCVIRPGQANPRHSHPNCCEVLVVMQGEVSHTLGGGQECILRPGDSVTVPACVMHQARNVGGVDAVLFIAFSSPDRQTLGE